MNAKRNKISASTRVKKFHEKIDVRLLSRRVFDWNIWHGLRRSKLKGALSLLLILSGCAFGSEGDQLETDAALLSYLLSTQNGGVVVLLRFGDNGIDGIDSFTSVPGAVALSTPFYIDIEKIDVYAGQNGVAYRRSYTLQFTELLSLLNPVTPLHAHEEDVAPSSGVVRIDGGHNVFAEPLSAGVNGNGRDSISRYYFETTPIALTVPTGGIQRIVVHVRRMQFQGTIGGSAFDVLYQTPSDFGVTPRCARNISTGLTTTIPLYFNYAGLFQGLTAANNAAVIQAFNSNIAAGGVTGEHECFQF